MKRRPRFAAIIATRDRPSLLARRALASVTGQSRLPDIVAVVDDSEPRIAAMNKKALMLFSQKTGVAAAHLPNCRGGERRTKNSRQKEGVFAGAHNRARNLGALHVLDAGFDPRATYVAVLDDDDEWLPHHLAQAEETARRGADFMPCAYERREPGRAYARTLPKFNGRDFLVGNPGVEGSTLIVRLSVFMRAGMFDDSLPASDDRDLCFRLSLLPDIAVAQPPKPSVIYYGDETRQRLTLRRGKAQLDGLSCFADKYRGWMSEKEYAAFRLRAKKLFGWEEKSPPLTPALSPVRRPSASMKNGKKIALVVGIIADSRRNPLFSDILRLAEDSRLSSVDVAVIPSSGRDRLQWRSEMEKWRRAGLRMHCIADSFPAWRELFSLGRLRGERPISVNRTMLQLAVSRLASAYRNPACWIVDGDCRLHGLAVRGGRIASFFPDYVGEMARLQSAGCDIAVGAINGAAPLPRAFTARTQMVDLMHALGRLLSPGDGHCPESILRANIGALGDYYHDCILHPHLEHPLGIAPPEADSAENLIKHLPRLLKRLLAGDWITRPLLYTGQLGSPHRGGNTLIFNPEILSTLPNGFVRGDLRGIRRQDEIWRVVAEKTAGIKIHPGDFPVTQSRKADAPQAPDIARMASDIAGHAIAAALRRVPGTFGNVEDMVKHILRPDSAFFDNVDAAARARVVAARASFFRASGAAASARAMVDSLGGGKSARNAAAALRDVERRFSEQSIAKARRQSARLLNRATLRKSMEDFPKICRDVAAMPALPEAWAQNQRKASAALLARRAAKKTPRFLGQGGEGAAFTDGRHVFKILHRWYSLADVVDPDFLPSLAGKWGAKEALYPVLRAENKGGDLLLTLPFEKTTPYRGGGGAGMVAMLAAMRKQGVVLWDITPKNLRQRDGMTRLIDYGRHLRLFTARDFDLMTRKAWLCCRLARREDLRALLTASLTNKNMPELEGYEILKAAVEQFALHSRVADTAARETARGGARRILDYGSGKGKDAAALATRGLLVDAYDPVSTKKAAARLQKSGARAVAAPDKEGAYDAILCRHVLCEIFSDKALRQCLRDMRRLLAPGGKAVVTACDMRGMARDTTCARQIFPRDAAADCQFNYRKLIRATGGVRAHIHRPESMLLREFSSAGFRVTARRAFSDIDINRFEPCGGVLQWILKPWPRAK